MRQEVARQIETMMHLNDTVKAHHGEPVFNDSDFADGRLRGGAEGADRLHPHRWRGCHQFALAPRGAKSPVDEDCSAGGETASSLLVPEGLTADAWAEAHRHRALQRCGC